MSRELLEFSNLIDEQFEPDTTASDELWVIIQSWFTHQTPKGGVLKQGANTQSGQQTQMVA